MLRFRQDFWAVSLYGDGGLAGVALFYPGVVACNLQDCVNSCLEYLADVYEAVWDEQHEFQWLMCFSEIPESEIRSTAG